MKNREPKEPLFHYDNRILAYFGCDLYEAAVTTRLEKDKTFFIPFNQGSNGAGNVGGAGNPEAKDGDYVTSYLWKMYSVEICSWLFSNVTSCAKGGNYLSHR